jgi:hypothetical protein
VTAADAGTTIVNTALATGTVTCESFCATATVQVVANATASVPVAEVGGISVTNPNAGICDPGSEGCDLPFTGASVWPWISGAGGAIALGLVFVLLTSRRRRTQIQA